jgi:signal transduction histidine kinase
MKGERLNYAARIQVYVYLAFLLPLIAVSITTLSLINKSEESEIKNEFLNKSKIIGDRLSIQLNSSGKSEEEFKSDFDSQLLNLTKLANLDASVFSKEGNLIASSQPLIYENQLVAGLIDREAWMRIVVDKETSFVENDAIGKLTFNTSYSSLKSPETGELIGILSIPFFDSAHSLERTQISVWVNILIVFVIVFLFFSLISFFIVNWLTFPLRFITRTLGKTTFSGKNKPLAWKSNDEIGLMVSEYNRMLENLELSKIELSRSEKESAWREIAKQIAHEINNPLTPMKLTLQRMELAQLNDNLSKEDTQKSLKTLLAQVEILNQIASSFSTFARMPAPVLQKMDLYKVLKRVADLHSADSSSAIFVYSIEDIYILGDEQLLTRVFSNIALNAQQSVGEGRSVKIEMVTKIDNDFCVTSISDNGNGIEEELIEKVFLPHFSTKKSGSGIGLAIAKQGIERSGGEIWFESKIGFGTTFYIKLPLYANQIDS